jgi:hypothetical protein
MMPHSESTWEPLGRVPTAALRDARLQLHHLVQLIPALGGALLDPEEDDGHRSMVWDPDLQGFRSRGLSASDDLHLVVRPLPLEIQIRARGQVQRYVLPGHSLGEAFDWVEREMSTVLGGDALTLDAPEYTIPEHRVGRHAFFDASPAALEELASWFQNGTQLLATLREESRLETTPLRAWPHHFDLAFRVLLPPGAVGQERSIGVGLSPGDEKDPDPYWYVAPWPRPATTPAMELPWGCWNTEGWFGAALRWDDMADWSEEVQPVRVREFLQAAMDSSRSLLEAAPQPKS